MAERNIAVDFHGKTVDQDGRVLPGVQIKFKVTHYLSAMQGMSIPVNLLSDANGLFDIHDAAVSGSGIDIGSMTKEGYTLEPMTKSFGPIGGAVEKPIVFRFWRNDIKEPLITGEKSFHIIPSGNPYVIDLSNGTIAESGTGDLSVWIKYATEVVPGQTYDWLSEIDAINGGLLEEPDLSSAMYEAPTTGYAGAFKYNQQIKGGQYGSTGEKRFYVMLKGGQEYGRITIELDAPYNKQIPGMIRLKYAINPTGSRILR